MYMRRKEEIIFSFRRAEAAAQQLSSCCSDRHQKAKLLNREKDVFPSIEKEQAKQIQTLFLLAYYCQISSSKG
jgi:hypothetical protein